MSSLRGMNDLKGQAKEVRRHLHSIKDKMKQMTKKIDQSVSPNVSLEFIIMF